MLSLSSQVYKRFIVLTIVGLAGIYTHLTTTQVNSSMLITVEEFSHSSIFFFCEEIYFMELLIDYDCAVKLNSSRKNMWLLSYKVIV